MAGRVSEQVAVVEKSSLSLEEMSSMTRQNAPDSKESSKAKEGMNAQAEHCVVLLGTSSLVQAEALIEGKKTSKDRPLKPS